MDLRRKSRTLGAPALTVGLLAATATLVSPTGALAAPGDYAYAHGQFLQGSLLAGVDTDVLVEIGGEEAESFGNARDGAYYNTLNLGLLDLLELPLGSGLGSIPLGTGLGVVGQYADASADGFSLAGAGLITNNGVIGTPDGPPPQPMRLALTDLLPVGPIADLVLEVDAATAVAEQTAGAAAVGDYELDNVLLTIKSLALSSITTTLADPDGPLAEIDAVVDTIETALDVLLLGTASVDLPSLQAVVDNLIGDPITNPAYPGLVVDLGAGTVAVDLDALLGALGECDADGPDGEPAGLSNCPVGYEIINDVVLTAITASLTGIVAAVLDELVTDLTEALGSTTIRANVPLLVQVDTTIANLLDDDSTNDGITILGAIEVGAITSLILPPVLALLDPTDGVLGTLESELIEPLLSELIPALKPVLNAVVQLIVNVQESTLTPVDAPLPDQIGFAQRALRIEVLPGTANLATLDLANATVGPNAEGGPFIDDDSGLNPPYGPDEGGTTVTVTGGNFTGATAVTLDDDDADIVLVPVTAGDPDTLEPGEFRVDSDTQITFITPANEPGPVGVFVTTPIGSSDSSTFTFVGIDSIDPDEGPETGGDVDDPATHVTITGACFTGATDVQFGGTSALDVTIVSDTEIVAVPPPGTPGVVDVTVVGADCGDIVEPDGYTYLANPPVLVALDPAEGPESGGTLVVVSGTDLDTTDGVIVDGVAYGLADDPADPLPGEFVVDEVAGTVTFVALPHAPGEVAVVVTNDGGPSAPLTYTYLAEPPTIISILPDQGVEAGGTVVTITGTQLDTATVVTLDGDDYTLVPGPDPQIGEFVVDADGTLTLMTLPHAPGPVDVSVTNDVGTATEPDGYTYVTQQMSTITIDPDSGPETGGTVVVVTGGPFGDADLVHINGFAIDITPDMIDVGDPLDDTDDTITFTTPAHTASIVQVFVEITDDDPTIPGGLGISDTQPFEYTAVVAAELALDPDNGPAAGGNAVTLSGTQLDTTVAVVFGDDDYAPALNAGNPLPGEFVINGDGTVTVVMRAHAPGPVDVVVTNDAGPSTEPLMYTYNQGSIDAIEPDRGPETGGDEDDPDTHVTITGECFTGATAVQFGGTPALAFTVVSDTVITAVPPPGAPGTVDVIVVSPLCGDIDLPDGYEYEPSPPDATGLSPTRGPETGGTVVTITGSGFTTPAVTAVRFGNVAAASFVVLSDTTVRAVTPAHAPGPVTVTVVSPAGSDTAGTFTFLAVPQPKPPTDLAADPTGGSEEGGTEVTLSGTNLSSATGVAIDATAYRPAVDPNDIHKGEYVIDPDGTISLVTLPHPPGPVDITVTNPDGTGSVVFTYTEAPLDASRFVPVTPCRLLDTRETAEPKPGTDSTRTLQVTGNCNVPDHAISVSLTLTVTETEARGHLTAWPDGEQPTVSNLNHGPGENRANSTVVRLSEEGTLQLYTYSPTHIVTDVTGYWVRSSGGTTSGRFVAAEPTRLLDTRLPGETPLGPFEVRTMPLPAGVPSDATALAINITMDDTVGPGWMAAYPANLPERPIVSAVNADGEGQIRAGSLIVPVSPEGFKIVSRLGGHAVIDYLGYFTGASSEMSTTGLFVPQAPDRVLDTREDPGARISGQTHVEVDTRVPGSGVIVNLTMVEPIGYNWLRTWPAGTPMPPTSSVNATTELAVANLAIIGQRDSRLNVFTKVDAHAVVDVAGWFYE